MVFSTLLNVQPTVKCVASCVIIFSIALPAQICFTHIAVQQQCSQTSLKFLKIYDKFTSVRPFLPDTTMSWQEILMLHMQALNNVNTTQACFGRNGYLMAVIGALVSMLPRHRLCTWNHMWDLEWLGDGISG